MVSESKTGNGRFSMDCFMAFTIFQMNVAVLDKYVEVVLSRVRPARYERHAGPLDLAKIYDRDPPAGGAHLLRRVIYAPIQCPDKSILITNSQDGSSSLAYLLAKEHHQFQVQVRSTRAGVAYPQNAIETWRDGISSRVVMAMRDSDKWIFFANGNPEPFEDVSLYQNKMKRERLTRKIIMSYLEKLGYSIATDSFWNSDSEAIYYGDIKAT